jgi:hypothetical protein
MSTISFHTDAKDIAVHSARLLRLTQNALPTALRNTLNATALDVKQRTMPQSSKRTFVEREPNFLKANSRVDFAKGTSLSNMASVVGIASLKKKPVKRKDLAVEDMEKQEVGGSIKRSLKALTGARTGGNDARRILRKFSIKNIDDNQSHGKVGAIDPRKSTSTKTSKGRRTAKGKFIRGAMQAVKAGHRLVLGVKNNKNGRRMMYYVKSFKRIQGNKAQKTRDKTEIKIVPLYSVKKGDKSHVKSTRFFLKASEQSGNTMKSSFFINAEKMIRKYS